MPNWTAITAEDLKAAGHGAIVDASQTTSTGTLDPVAEEIAVAVARVRRAVAAGNSLDADTTKVPLSLKGLTVRMALYALMERIQLSLSEDQRETRKNDNSDLLRIADRKILVESPDTAATTSSVPQTFGNWNSERKVLPRAYPHPAPGNQNSSDGYANSNGPEDQTV